jgi:dihydroflavonol-4-reductase
MKTKKVLLTGITGFLGSHTAIQFLEKDYEVLGTVRNINRAKQIHDIISKYTLKAGNLSFAEAELEDSEIWESLTRGVDYVQHIASPFPRELPKDEEELIKPAREGVLNVLKAAAKNGVKRVVLTSSAAAIVYGKKKGNRSGIYNEENWTALENTRDLTPYIKSKTLAESAAWEFMQKETTGMELTTVCPGAILGPVLEQDFGTSANIVIKTLDGSIPALPDIGFDIVDVRSVADLLIKAMENPVAANKRYVAANGFYRFKEVAQVLKNNYPDKKVSNRIMPNFFTRLFSNFDPSLKPILIDLGQERKLDSSKAKKELNWKPILAKEAILSCAESVVQQGLVS